MSSSKKYVLGFQDRLVLHRPPKEVVFKSIQCTKLNRRISKNPRERKFDNSHIDFFDFVGAMRL